MPSVTSLLRSAQAAQKKAQSYKDAVAAFEWESSAQTYEDYVAYSGYLTQQGQSTTDPSTALGYQSKLRTANRTFTANEIQRETMKVVEGRGTTLDKMASVSALYQRAVDSGDLNLAQNLFSQWDSLSVQHQNETESRAAAGQALNSQLSALRAANAQDGVETIKSYMGELGNLFKSAGQEKFTKEIKSYAKELGLQEDANFFDIYTNLAEQAVGVYDSAIAQETDPAKQRTLQIARNKLATEATFDLPSTGKTTLKVSLQDLKDQSDAARVGETVFQQTQTQAGTVFKRNKQTGFVWGRDEQGNYKQIPLYNPNHDYTSKVLKPGSKDEYESYKTLLENAGVKVTDSDGVLTIQNTGNLPGFYGSPFPTGQNIEVTVGTDGQLQVSDGEKAYTLGFDEKGQFQGLRDYAPSSITQVNGANYTKGDARFNRGFLDTLNLNNYAPDISKLVGIVDPALMEKYRQRVANFNLVGASSPNLSPTSLLQTNLQAKSLQASAPVARMQPAVAAPVIQPTAPAQNRSLNPYTLPPVPNLRVTKSPVPQLKPVTSYNPGTLGGVRNFNNGTLLGVR